MREISRINAERAKSCRRIRNLPPYNKRAPHNSLTDIANRLYNEVLCPWHGVISTPSFLRI